MFSKRTMMLTTAACWVLCLSAAEAEDRACADLQSAKVSHHVEYLQRDRRDLKPACVALAVNQIGIQKYAPAIRTLVTLLDYRLPENPGAPLVGRIRSLGTVYPAAAALFEIGKPAIPDLIEAIGSSSTSDVARDNAVLMVFMIHSSDVAEAVRVLVRASKTGADREASMRLYDAARKAADMCKGENRNACMNALQ